MDEEVCDGEVGFVTSGGLGEEILGRARKLVECDEV